MVDQPKHTILVVDDEESIRKALRRLFKRAGYHILVADGGADGLDEIKKSVSPITLIISDQRMPGMNGAEFLEQAKKICPDAIRFLLTGYSDMDALVSAINEGEIHRYLAKPWNDEDLLIQVRQAIEQYELVVENKKMAKLIQRQNQDLQKLNDDLESQVIKRTRAIIMKHDELEKSMMESFRLLIFMVEMMNPLLGEYLIHSGRLAGEVARQMGLDKTVSDTIEIAGMFHDMGLLGMPESVLAKRKHEMETTEYDLYTQHPVIVAVSFQAIPRLSDVAEMILCHHENYDGTGYPNGLQKEDIPLGSRIIAAVSDYCRVIYTWPHEEKKIRGKARACFDIVLDDALSSKDAETLLVHIADTMLEMGSGKKYDAKVTDVLKQVVSIH